MAVAQRYDRQARIEGWDQTSLEKTVLTIVGNNTFSEYLALSSSALGIGKIRLISTPYEEISGEAPFLNLSNARTREQKLEEMIKNIGQSKFERINAHMKNRAEEYFLDGSSVVVDASGRHESRALCLNYTINTGVACELVQFSKNGFTATKKDESPLIFFENADSRMDNISAMVASGIVLEEIKKHIFGRIIERNPLQYEFPQKTEDEKTYSKIKALIIGAGALGNFAAPGLAYLGLKKMDIMDDDRIEETNLNRQISFFGAVGMLKAEVLAERCAKMSGNKVNYQAITKRFGKEDSVKEYDIVFDCVDNFETRALLSKKCIEAKIPLISGGTSYRAGQAVVYSPNTTSCPNHILDLEIIAKKRKEERRRQEQEQAGCLYQPDPSVIMTNQITAGLMLNGMRQLFLPDVFGKPINGQTRYDSLGAQRLGIIEMKNRCGD